METDWADDLRPGVILPLLRNGDVLGPCFIGVREPALPCGLGPGDWSAQDDGILLPAAQDERNMSFPWRHLSSAYQVASHWHAVGGVRALPSIRRLLSCHSVIRSHASGDRHYPGPAVPPILCGSRHRRQSIARVRD